jgi:hypothetical protein
MIKRFLNSSAQFESVEAPFFGQEGELLYWQQKALSLQERVGRLEEQLEARALAETRTLERQQQAGLKAELVQASNDRLQQELDLQII